MGREEHRDHVNCTKLVVIATIKTSSTTCARVKPPPDTSAAAANPRLPSKTGQHQKANTLGITRPIPPIHARIEVSLEPPVPSDLVIMAMIH